MFAWPEVEIGSVSTLVERTEVPGAGVAYRQLGVRLWGEGAYEREAIDGSATRYGTLNRVKAGDIVVNKIWARSGSVSVVSPELEGAYVSSEFPLFEPHLDRLEPRWFYWITKARWFWNRCDEKARGTSGKNRIRPKQFAAIKIPLPPLVEQRRIVAVVERLAGKIAEARGLRERAVAEVEVLLASAFKSVFAPDRGWETKRVGDFCGKPQYGYTASAVRESIGPRMLRITDIQEGRVEWNTVPFCACPEPNQYLLQKNDILFARTGATTGKSFLIEDCPVAVFASYLIRLRIQDASVLPTYLYAFFQTPAYWSQIEDRTRGTGQPNCNGQRLANLVVPVPPVDEQRRIVAYLDSLQAKVDQLKALQAQTAVELEALLPAVLERAFRGEL